MEWLTPLTAIYAALVTLPLLLLLYFLKLKRREQIVPSTLLWKRAVRDLQVNAPFQRLRRNILLLLQLLILLAILLALGGPILSSISGQGKKYVLLIDRSASMNATDLEPSRLEEAKRQAKDFVESLSEKSVFSLTGRSDQTMVIAFDKRAKVMCNYTSDKHQLNQAIEAISPSDNVSSLAEAVVVASAYAQSLDSEMDDMTESESARLVLFSDGRVQDIDQVAVGSDEVIFNSVGESSENVAITAMQARRSYEQPDHVEVFATLINYGPDSVTSDVQLSINNNVHAVRSVTVPGKKIDDSTEKMQPGKVAVNFSLSYAQAGVLEVRQLHQDSLACDDAAWAILMPPKKLSVLLVTTGNVALEYALKACSLARFEIISPSDFNESDPLTFGVEQLYDVIVLDNHQPEHLPKSRYLVFGRPLEGIDVPVSSELENQVIVDWMPKHPVLSYVNLTNFFAAKCFKYEVPRDAEVLAEFNETPAFALVRRNGSTFLLAGFDVLQTNWPFEPGFVLFCYNAVNFLGTQTGQNRQMNLQVGEPIIFEGYDSEETVKVDGPGFSDVEIASDSVGTIRFSNTEQVGIYRLSVPEQPAKFFAVNLLNPEESNIEPRDEIVFALTGESVESQKDVLSRANLPLWPFLVGFALLLACLEWLVYNFKARI